MAKNIFALMLILCICGCMDEGSANGTQQTSNVNKFVPNNTSTTSSFVYENANNHLELNEDLGGVITNGGIGELNWKHLEGGRIYYANGISVVEQKLKLNGTPAFTTKTETLNEALLEVDNSSKRFHEAQHNFHEAEQAYLTALQNNSPDLRKKEDAMNEARRKMHDLEWLNYTALDLVYNIANHGQQVKTLDTFLKFPADTELFKYAVTFSPPLKGDLSGVKFNILGENAEIKSLKNSTGSAVLELKVGNNTVLLIEKQPNGQDATVYINNKKIEAKASIQYTVNSTELSLSSISYAPTAHSLQHAVDNTLSDDVQVKERYPLDLYVSQPEALLSTKWEVMYNGPKDTNYRSEFSLKQNGNEYDVMFHNPQGEWFNFKLLEYNGTTYTANVINAESETIKLGENILLSDADTTAVLRYNWVQCGVNSSGVLEAQWVTFENLHDGNMWWVQVNSGTQDGTLWLNNGSSFKFVVVGNNCDELKFDHNGDGVISNGLALIRLTKDYVVKLGKLDKNMTFPVFSFSVPSNVMENPPAVNPFIEIAFWHNATLNVSTLGFNTTQSPWAWSTNNYQGLAQDGSRLSLGFWNQNNRVSFVVPETQVFYEVQLNGR